MIVASLLVDGLLCVDKQGYIKSMMYANSWHDILTKHPLGWESRNCGTSSE